MTLILTPAGAVPGTQGKQHKGFEVVLRVLIAHVLAQLCRGPARAGLPTPAPTAARCAAVPVW